MSNKNNSNENIVNINRPKRKRSDSHSPPPKRKCFTNYENEINKLKLENKQLLEEMFDRENELLEELNNLKNQNDYLENEYSSTKSELINMKKLNENLEKECVSLEEELIKIENKQSKTSVNQKDKFFEELLNTPIIFKIPVNKKSKSESPSPECCEVKNPEKEIEEDSDPEVDDHDWEHRIINENVETLDDLIKLGNIYDPNIKIKYNINIRKLNKLIEPLQKLKNMIGMEKVKKTIVDQILYFLQGIDDKNKDMLHCVIEGPPGVGKTEVAKILGQIYRKMGILSSDKFKSVKRSHLIGGYLGQTAIKTQKVLDECNGGVLFIDEAYSLGNSEGKDSYSKECIDTLTAHLSENKQNFICIIAGYKNSLKECFFKYNEGLERRFPYRFEIDKYTPYELSQIFVKIVKEYEWNVSDNFDSDFFTQNIDYFTFNGGDMELLFHKCKIAHSRRVFMLPKEVKKILTNQDLQEGLELLLNNDEIAKRKEKVENWYNMYS